MRAAACCKCNFFLVCVVLIHICMQHYYRRTASTSWTTHTVNCYFAKNDNCHVSAWRPPSCIMPFLFWHLTVFQRAELATEQYLPLTSVLEGFVILKPNPEWRPPGEASPSKKVSSWWFVFKFQDILVQKISGYAREAPRPRDSSCFVSPAVVLVTLFGAVVGASRSF